MSIRMGFIVILGLGLELGLGLGLGFGGCNVDSHGVYWQSRAV